MGNHTLTVPALPQTLDEMVTLMRDEYRLTIASQDDMKPFLSTLQEAQIRHALSQWNLVALHGPFGWSLFLVGWVGPMAWCTSAVEDIDLENRLIRTQNSLYRVEGEPAPESDLPLWHVAATFNAWGLGQMLGMPGFVL